MTKRSLKQTMREMSKMASASSEETIRATVPGENESADGGYVSSDADEEAAPVKSAVRKRGESLTPSSRPQGRPPIPGKPPTAGRPKKPQREFDSAWIVVKDQLEEELKSLKTALKNSESELQRSKERVRELENASANDSDGSLFGVRMLPALDFSHLIASSEDRRARSLNVMASVYEAIRQDARLNPLRYWVANMQVAKRISKSEGHLKIELDSALTMVRMQERKIADLMLESQHGAACMKTFIEEAWAEEEQRYGRKISRLEEEVELLRDREVRRQLDRVTCESTERKRILVQQSEQHQHHVELAQSAGEYDATASRSIFAGFQEGLVMVRRRRQELVAKKWTSAASHHPA